MGAYAVTGSASGMGQAVVARLRAAGHTVIGVDIQSADIIADLSTAEGRRGAIAGVLGAYIVLYPRARVWSLVPFLLFIPLRLPAWLVLGGWFLLQWFYTAQVQVSTGGDSVAYLAHVFGFLTGMLLALPLRGRRPLPQPPVWPQRR